MSNIWEVVINYKSYMIKYYPAINIIKYFNNRETMII